MRALFWLRGAMSVALAMSASAAEGRAVMTANSGRLDMTSLAADTIDPKAAAIPVIPTINGVFRGAGLKRGEFETSSAFQARQDSIGGLRALLSGGPLLLDAKVNQTNGVDAHFDPDAELLSFVVHSHESMLTVGGSYSTITVVNLGAVAGAERSYVGQNAFGAKAVITKSGQKFYGVAFSVKPEFPSVNYLEQSTLAVKMGAAQAKREIPRLKAVFVMQPVQPGIATSIDYKTATFSDPEEHTYEGRYLLGTFSGVVVYSGITGKVLARYPEGFGKPTEASGSAAN